MAPTPSLSFPRGHTDREARDHRSPCSPALPPAWTPTCASPTAMARRPRAGTSRSGRGPWSRSAACSAWTWGTCAPCASSSGERARGQAPCARGQPGIADVASSGTHHGRPPGSGSGWLPHSFIRLRGGGGRLWLGLGGGGVGGPSRTGGSCPAQQLLGWRASWRGRPFFGDGWTIPGSVLPSATSSPPERPVASRRGTNQRPELRSSSRAGRAAQWLSVKL